MPVAGMPGVSNCAENPSAAKPGADCSSPFPGATTFVARSRGVVNCVTRVLGNGAIKAEEAESNGEVEVFGPDHASWGPLVAEFALLFTDLNCVAIPALRVNPVRFLTPTFVPSREISDGEASAIASATVPDFVVVPAGFRPSICADPKRDAASFVPKPGPAVVVPADVRSVPPAPVIATLARLRITSICIGAPRDLLHSARQ